MLSIAERHKYILDSLNRRGFVRITDVANELGVTKVTIRKDVKILESKGLLYKVHGSARPANPHVADLDVHVKDNINREAKRAIARRAVELLDDNDSVIVASGSTIHAFAEEIRPAAVASPEYRHAVPAAGRAAQRGRERRCGAGSAAQCTRSRCPSRAARRSGRSTTASARRSFFGVDGIDLEHGITTSTIEEAKLTRRMMEAASQTIVLADSSKFRTARLRPYRFARGDRRDRDRSGGFRTDGLGARRGGGRSDRREVGGSAG